MIPVGTFSISIRKEVSTLQSCNDFRIKRPKLSFPIVPKKATFDPNEDALAAKIAVEYSKL